MANPRDRQPGGKPSHSAEQQLIQDLFAPLAKDYAGALGLRDDAATVAVEGGHELVVSKDMLVAGVHFFADDPADLVARKAVRVNLSDLAAKGARPTCYFLGIALPRRVGHDWLELFVAGLLQDQGQYSIDLAGGDTVRTDGPLTISVTAMGDVPVDKAVRRAGAQGGDRVYVSGTIGDAVLGLALAANEKPSWAESLDTDDVSFLKDRYHLPQPRTELGPVVRDHATASMDVSDGLAGDLALLCAASGVGAEIVLANVPLSRAARAACDCDRSLLRRLVSGGDDYEILCTVSPDKCIQFEDAAATVGVHVSRIGSILDEQSGLSFFDESGSVVEMTSLSYSHL